MRFTVALLCFAGVAAAQPVQADPREVVVDAIVTTKNGAYVPDLSAKDFHLSQDGKEQSIQSFALESRAESAPATAQPRSVALFFDATSMETRDMAAAVQAAAAFIDTAAGPNHQMALMVFDGSLRMLQNFTGEAGVLKDALNQGALHGLAHSSASSDRSRDTGRVDEDRLGGRSGNALATSFDTRNMIRSLSGLAQNLGALPGRKIVILFAGALSSLTDPKVEMRDAIEAANKSRVAFYPVDVRPVLVQTDPVSDPTTLQTQQPGNLQRGGLGAQGDPGGLGTPLPDIGGGTQSILSSLASGTGGFAVLNTADVPAGLRNIAKEQDQYYVLTYTAPESKEGTCHSIRVKVDRKQTAVRARTRYCSERPN
jgi:VWFA-related protein